MACLDFDFRRVDFVWLLLSFWQEQEILSVDVLLIRENIVTLYINNKKHNIYGISNSISASVDWRSGRKV